MSNVSTQHDIVLYTGKNKPLAGQQLLTYTFRAIKEGSELAQAGFQVGTKPDNICVSVPPVTSDDIRANIDKLLPAIHDVILGARKEILKDAFKARKSTLSDDDISLAAVIVKLSESVSSDGRLSKAIVKDWFESVAVDILYPSIASALGVTPDTPETSPSYVKLLNTLQAVLDLLNSFLFAKKSVDSAMLSNVERVINKLLTSLSQDVIGSDEILQAFITKIRVNKEKPAEDLLSLI